MFQFFFFAFQSNQPSAGKSRCKWSIRRKPIEKHKEGASECPGDFRHLHIGNIGIGVGFRYLVYDTKK